jgi:fermentation-respiration switch protein FrsA (DUF1100 family)
VVEAGRVTGQYWRDLFRYQPVPPLSALPQPILVLQGAEDIQVTRRDFDIVRQALAAKPPAMQETVWLPGLNHLFMPAANSTGAEYGRPSHVSPDVIDRVSHWIRHQAAGPGGSAASH